jgi:hypothetical protein
VTVSTCRKRCRTFWGARSRRVATPDICLTSRVDRAKRRGAPPGVESPPNHSPAETPAIVTDRWRAWVMPYFYRVTSGRTRDIAGTRLRLAVCRRIAQGREGTIALSGAP